jgi:hypothetical protein
MKSHQATSHVHMELSARWFRDCFCLHHQELLIECLICVVFMWYISQQPLMMETETVSETLVSSSALTIMITQEDLSTVAKKASNHI